MGDVPIRLAPDDLFPAELAQDLVEDANDARDRVLVAHRPQRPNPGAHVSLIEPIATFRYDLPEDRNTRDAQGQTRFHAGLADVPRWGFGNAPFAGGFPAFWIEFETARAAPIWGVQVGVGWRGDAYTQTHDLVLPLRFHAWNKGWIAWPRRIDTNTGRLVLGQTPQVEQVAWVTVAVMGTSPWR